MGRKFRIAAVASVFATGLILAVIAGAYYATRQVQPFYEQALRIEPEILQRGRRELESRATALYSDAQQRGQWQALFTAEQINGWLAVQLSGGKECPLPAKIRDPRVAIAPGVLTLGFRTKNRGVDTVVSVEASVFLTEHGAVGIRFKSVRAGALPLPMLALADELAAACKELRLPVRWTQKDGQPIAVVEIQSDPSAEKRQFLIDSIELRKSELYVAGHTDVSDDAPPEFASRPQADKKFALTDYELRISPDDNRSALQIARRDKAGEAEEAPVPNK